MPTIIFLICLGIARTVFGEDYGPPIIGPVGEHLTQPTSEIPIAPAVSPAVSAPVIQEQKSFDDPNRNFTEKLRAAAGSEYEQLIAFYSSVTESLGKLQNERIRWWTKEESYLKGANLTNGVRTRIQSYLLNEFRKREKIEDTLGLVASEAVNLAMSALQDETKMKIEESNPEYRRGGNPSPSKFTRPRRYIEKFNKYWVGIWETEMPRRETSYLSTGQLIEPMADGAWKYSQKPPPLEERQAEFERVVLFTEKQPAALPFNEKVANPNTWDGKEKWPLPKSSPVIVEDIEGNDIRGAGLLLMDFPCHMANPAVTFFLRPSNAARLPMTVSILANSTWLSLNEPSESTNEGPVKIKYKKDGIGEPQTITFTDYNMKIPIHISAFPDRNNVSERYQLTVAANETVWEHQPTPKAEPPPKEKAAIPDPPQPSPPATTAAVYRSGVEPSDQPKTIVPAQTNVPAPVIETPKPPPEPVRRYVESKTTVPIVVWDLDEVKDKALRSPVITATIPLPWLDLPAENASNKRNLFFSDDPFAIFRERKSPKHPNPFTIQVNFSHDESGHFDDDETQELARQAADDWSCILDDMNWFPIDPGKEITDIMRANGSRYSVTNEEPVSDYMLYVTGDNSGERTAKGWSEHLDDDELNNGSYAKPTPKLQRSGQVLIKGLTTGNRYAIYSEKDWYKVVYREANPIDEFSYHVHELGHALGMYVTYPWVEEWLNFGAVRDLKMQWIMGHDPKIDKSAHFVDEIDPLTLRGMYGTYRGPMRHGPWIINPADAQLMDLIGYNLKPLPQFQPLRMTIYESYLFNKDQRIEIPFRVEGGVPRYMFKVVAGKLPTGLRLDPLFPAIRGTARDSGIFPVLVEVVDQSGKRYLQGLTLSVQNT